MISETTKWTYQTEYMSAVHCTLCNGFSLKKKKVCFTTMIVVSDCS